MPPACRVELDASQQMVKLDTIYFVGVLTILSVAVVLVLDCLLTFVVYYSVSTVPTVPCRL